LFGDVPERSDNCFLQAMMREQSGQRNIGSLEKTMNGEFWKRKLLAHLHDPPSKALDVARHGEQSVAAMVRAGLEEAEARAYNRAADYAAAAADRLPFPSSKASGLRCAFDGIKNAFLHPLSGSKLPFSEAFPTAEFGIEIEQGTQPVLDHFGSLSEDQQWRARFFAHWRLWPKNAAEKDWRFGYVPADTRMPDHTIWNHMQVVSALAGCATGEEKDARLEPAFLKFQIGPVQEFIAQARSTRDLWSGSYLLSWLMAAGLKRLSELAGPDAVIFPSLRGQPLFDLHWRRELWDQVRMAKESKTVWESLKHEPADLLTPNLPNVFLAVVPAKRAGEVAQAIETAIQEEWKRIAESVWNYCDSAVAGEMHLTADEGSHLTRELRKRRFDAQVNAFLAVSWQATPWPKTLREALALADGFAGETPVAEARQRVEAVVKMATDTMPAGHRDERFYTNKEKCELNNVGLAWSVMVAFNSWQMDAVRQTKAFSAWASGGWESGTENNKDALNGRDEAVAGGQVWQERCGKLGKPWSELFKKSDWVGAITLIKRVWHISYLENAWDLHVRRDMRTGSTRAIAGHNPDAPDEELDPESEPGEKYFAVLALDGDEIGKWMSGEKTCQTEGLLADYEAGGTRAGARVYFEENGGAKFLKSQRPLSPSYHLQFSEALANFALKCVRPIVDAFDGKLIYAGGDDVLAMVPADNALACARTLRAAFRGDPAVVELLRQAEKTGRSRYFKRLAGERGLIRSTEPGFVEYCEGHSDQRHEPIPLVVPGPEAEVSVGIAIAHFKSPLQDVVKEAQAAEKRAKTELGRSAVAVSLFKRSGETVKWGCQWESGGLRLFELLLSSIISGVVSGKFPHRVIELLEPYLLSRSGLYIMKGAPGFDTLAVIECEFGHALVRQTNAHGPAKEALLNDLRVALRKYLEGAGTREGATNDDIIQNLIALCQTVAFAARTAPEANYNEP
jgi:CRISPR-associated protein Cmr2